MHAVCEIGNVLRMKRQKEEGFNDFFKILDWKRRTNGLEFRDTGNYEKEWGKGKEVQETEKLNSEF